MIARHERGVGRLVARPHDDERRIAGLEKLVQLHLGAQFVRGVKNLALPRTRQQLHVQALRAEPQISVRFEQAVVHGDNPCPRRRPFLRRQRAGRRHEPEGRATGRQQQDGGDFTGTVHHVQRLAAGSPAHGS